MRLRGVLLSTILFCAACTPSAALQGTPAGAGQLTGGRPASSGQPATRTPFQPLAAEPSTPTAAPVALPEATVIPALAPPTSTTEAAAPSPASPGQGLPLPVWVDPLLPAGFRAGLSLPAELAALPAESPAEAGSLRLEAGGGRPISQWVYALVAPFPTRVEGVSAETLRNAWIGSGESPWGSLPLMLDPGTLGMLSAAWGAPAEGAVRVLGSEEMLGEAWKKQPAWAIIPFESLEIGRAHV